MPFSGATNSELATKFLGDSVDYRDPLTRGLFIAVPFFRRGPGNTVFDFSKNKRHGTFEGTRRFDPGISGMAGYAPDDADANLVNFGESSFLPTGTDVTFLSRFELYNTAEAQSAFGLFSGVVGQDFGTNSPHSDGNTYWQWPQTGTGGSIAGSLTYTGVHTMIYTCGPRGKEVFQDGILRLSNGLISPARAASTSDFAIGLHSSFGGLASRRDFCLIGWDRQLSRGEIDDITQDPFLLWRRRRRAVVFVPPVLEERYTDRLVNTADSRRQTVRKFA